MIKKHKNKNEYYYAGHNLWVRNFTKKIQPVDINNLISESDMNFMLTNEAENYAHTYQRIDTEDFSHPNAVIVSDGYKWDEKQKILEGFP